MQDPSPRGVDAVDNGTNGGGGGGGGVFDFVKSTVEKASRQASSLVSSPPAGAAANTPPKQTAAADSDDAFSTPENQPIRPPSSGGRGGGIHVLSGGSCVSEDDSDDTDTDADSGSTTEPAPVVDEEAGTSTDILSTSVATSALADISSAAETSSDNPFDRIVAMNSISASASAAAAAAEVAAAHANQVANDLNRADPLLMSGETSCSELDGESYASDTSSNQDVVGRPAMDNSHAWRAERAFTAHVAEERSQSSGLGRGSYTSIGTSGSSVGPMSTSSSSAGGGGLREESVLGAIGLAHAYNPPGLDSEESESDADVYESEEDDSEGDLFSPAGSSMAPQFPASAGLLTPPSQTLQPPAAADPSAASDSESNHNKGAESGNETETTNISNISGETPVMRNVSEKEGRRLEPAPTPPPLPNASGTMDKGLPNYTISSPLDDPFDDVDLERNSSKGSLDPPGEDHTGPLRSTSTMSAAAAGLLGMGGGAAAIMTMGEDPPLRSASSTASQVSAVPSSDAETDLMGNTTAGVQASASAARSGSRVAPNTASSARSPEDRSWISRQKRDVRVSNREVPLHADDSVNRTTDSQGGSFRGSDGAGGGGGGVMEAAAAGGATAAARSSAGGGAGQGKRRKGWSLTWTEKWLCAGMAVLLCLGIAGIVLGTVGWKRGDGEVASAEDGGGIVGSAGDDGGGGGPGDGGAPGGDSGDDGGDDTDPASKFEITWPTSKGYPSAPSYASRGELSYSLYTVKVLSQCLEQCAVLGAEAGIFLLEQDVDNCRCDWATECLVLADDSEEGNPVIEDGLVFSSTDRMDPCVMPYCHYFGWLDDACAGSVFLPQNETDGDSDDDETKTPVGEPTLPPVPTVAPSPRPTRNPSADECDYQNCDWGPSSSVNPVAGSEIGDFSGTSLALSEDGRTLAVGEIGHLGGRGRVRVFVRSDTSDTDSDDRRSLRSLKDGDWTPLGYGGLMGGIPGKGDAERFGVSVSLSADGRTLAAGGDGADWGYGVVRVYDYDPDAEELGGWVQRGKDLVGAGPDDVFGRYVSLGRDGNALAAGSAGSADASSGGNYVNVYNWDGDAWAPKGTNIRVGGAVSGVSLASNSGDIVAIGSAEQNFVKVYHWKSGQGPKGDLTEWSRKGAMLTNDDSLNLNDGNATSTSSANFGKNVALSAAGNVLAIGAPGDDSGGIESGSVRLYRWKDDGVVEGWRRIGNDIFGGADYDHAGDALALSADGTTLVVGSPGPKDRPAKMSVYEIFPAATESLSDGGSWTGQGSVTGLSAIPSVDTNRPFLSLALSEDGKFLAAGHANADFNGVTSFYEYEVVPTAEPTLAPTPVPSTLEPTAEPVATTSPTAAAPKPSGPTFPAPEPTEPGTTTEVPPEGTTEEPMPTESSSNFPPPPPPTTPPGSPDPTSTPTSDPTYGPTLSPRPTPLPTTSEPTRAPVPTNPPSAAPTPDPCSGVGNCDWSMVPGAVFEGLADGDKFGTSTAVSDDGTTIVVGGRGSALSPGYVQAYRLVGNAWRPLGQRLAGTLPFDRFGISVDVSGDGNRMVVGADGFDRGGSNRGIVIVYQLRPDGDWDVLGSGLAGPDDYDNVGWTVSMSKDGNVVAYGASDKYTAIYAWDEAGGDWKERGTKITWASRSGRSLALSADGTVVAIGVTGNNGVRVYEYDSGNNQWDLRDEIIRGPNNGNVGASVTLSSDGNTLVFGSPLSSGNRGSVETYTWDGSAGGRGGGNGKWTKEGNDLQGVSPGDYFGTAVKLNGDGTILAVGSPGLSSEDSGLPGQTTSTAWTVRVYENAGPLGWQILGTAVAGGTEARGVNRGEPNLSVALNAKGRMLVVGSALNSDGGDERGMVSVYRYNN